MGSKTAGLSRSAGDTQTVMVDRRRYGKLPLAHKILRPQIPGTRRTLAVALPAVPRTKSSSPAKCRLPWGAEV